MTIGINFIYKFVTVYDVKNKSQIWDTVGKDKYKTITQSYYNGNNGVIVVYSVDCRSSFNSISNKLFKYRELDQ
jgi:GTPase SAR1 family protein